MILADFRSTGHDFSRLPLSLGLCERFLSTSDWDQQFMGKKIMQVEVSFFAPEIKGTCWQQDITSVNLEAEEAPASFLNDSITLLLSLEWNNGRVHGEENGVES